jgi:hypothetical protein
MTNMYDDDFHAHLGWTWNIYLGEKVNLKVICRRNECFKKIKIIRCAIITEVKSYEKMSTVNIS